MKGTRIATALGTLMLICRLAAPSAAETLDRIVAVIDNSFIITMSDIRKERALQTALGEMPGNDESLLQTLIESRLIEEQIAQFREIEVVEEDVERRLRQATPTAGVSGSDLRNAVVRELRRNEFIIQRFRQFIRVSDEELRAYYEKVYVPELLRLGQPVPSAAQGMIDVRPNVIAEKLSQEVGEWMSDLRGRSNVEILK